jgi:putative ABC transport system permease protein
VLNDLRYRLRALFRRAAMERELDLELRFHLEQETEKYEREGLRPEAAARRARVAFGGLEQTKEDSRDARGIAWIENAVHDARHALRSLLAAPGFTLAVILTLGLGVGANAAMFGVVDRLMIRTPAYLRDPARVHRVYLFSTDRGVEQVLRGYEFTRYLDLVRWTRSFDATAAFQFSEFAVGSGEETREMPVLIATASYFDFFDAKPALGRFYTRAEDHVPSGAPVVVLSYPFWQSRYGGREDVLGTTLQVGSVAATIIGVAPQGFTGATDGRTPAVIFPLTTYAGARRRNDPTNYYTRYNWGWVDILVRRKPSVSEAVAVADLTTAYRRSWQAERALTPEVPPVEIGRPRADLGPVQLARAPGAGPDGQVAIWVGGVALIVLLIACANVANLLLVRAIRRRREIAVRLALGISRARLLGQLFTESLLLALLAGAVGLLVAQWGGAAMTSLFLPEGMEASALGDGRTIVFAALTAVATGLLAGLAPAWHAGRGNLGAALKAGAREGTYHRSRTRTALLVLQGALSVVLLVAAGLFVRSLQHVRALRLGFDTEQVLYVRPEYRGMQVPEEERAQLVRRLEAEARDIPGVADAARGLTVPFWDTWSQGLFVEGIDSVHRLGHFTLQGGSPELLPTVGTRLLRGRNIERTDRAAGPLVVLVSEAMARTLWPGREAIGQCLRMDSPTAPCRTVVGIVEDIKQTSLTEDAGLHYYLPIEQFHPADASLFVRATGDVTRLGSTVRRRLQPLMPGTAYLTVTPMRQIVDPLRRAWQSGATMFLVLGALALVVAALGLYSVIAYSVAQRTHEMGVRIALGAEQGHLLRLVLGEGLRFALAGIAIGSGLALIAGRWIGPLLFAESPRDPAVFVAVTGTLLLAAISASAVPAMRATRVNPVTALNTD